MQATKNYIFLSLFSVLLLPAMQHSFSFVKSEPLFGFFDVAENDTLSWSKWIEGTYQQKKAAYINDHVGFRPDIIRIKNQLDFTLFRKFNCGNALLGKQHYLFWEYYFDSWSGKDFIGDSLIRSQMMRLKALQDTLSHLGKSLLLVHCPNKAFFYPEYIPDAYRKKYGPTNYSSYLRIGDSLAINSIDFNAWFLSMKDTSKELLFSKQGIHWTTYGSVLAGDSLVRYIERDRGLVIGHATWARTEHVQGPRDPDADIARTINLLFPFAKERFCYPLLKYDEGSNGKKPKAIIIGDSFGQNFAINQLLQHSFSSWQYWYYFNCIVEKNAWGWVNGNNTLIKDINWTGAIDSTDCVILLYTSINLAKGEHTLGSGFIEAAYAHYFPATH